MSLSSYSPSNRKQLGTSYHRKTTLSFCDINVLNKWLEALAPDARDMLRSINYEHDPSRSSSCDGADRISRFSIEQRIWQLLIEKGVPSPSEVMSTKDYVLFKLCRGR